MLWPRPRSRRTVGCGADLQAEAEVEEDGYAPSRWLEGVCGLRTNGTIRCFGDGVASPSDDLAGLQYIDVQAQGDALYGVLMVKYSSCEASCSTPPMASS